MAESHPDRPTTIMSRTTNGSGSYFKLRSLMAKDSGVCTIIGVGTWDGGTITLDIATDSSGTNVVGTTETLSADGQLTVALSPDLWIRMTLSGAGGSTDVDAVAL